MTRAAPCADDAARDAIVAGVARTGCNPAGRALYGPYDPEHPCPSPAADNPLLAPDWTGPFGVPPFGRIAPEHFRPAFERAFAEHDAEIAAIAGDPAEPTFANTIEALERAAGALERVASVFFMLAGANTNDALQAIEREIAPLLARALERASI